MGLINKVTNHYIRLLPAEVLCDHGIIYAFMKTYKNIDERIREKQQEFKIYVFRNKLGDYLSNIYLEKYAEDPETYSKLGQFYRLLQSDLNKPFEHKIFLEDENELPYVAPIEIGTKAYDICKSLGFEDSGIMEPIEIISAFVSALGPQNELLPINDGEELQFDLNKLYPNLKQYGQKRELMAKNNEILTSDGD